MQSINITRLPSALVYAANAVVRYAEDACTCSTCVTFPSFPLRAATS